MKFRVGIALLMVSVLFVTEAVWNSDSALRWGLGVLYVALLLLRHMSGVTDAGTLSRFLHYLCIGCLVLLGLTYMSVSASGNGVLVNLRVMGPGSALVLFLFASRIMHPNLTESTGGSGT